MKKETLIRIVICLLLLVMISWLCSCSVAVATADLATAPEKPAEEVTFSFVTSQVVKGKTIKICKCDQTGVLYSFGSQEGLCALLNPDGTPMLWEG